MCKSLQPERLHTPVLATIVGFLKEQRAASPSERTIWTAILVLLVFGPQASSHHWQGLEHSRTIPLAIL
jgi:hypothetical protein